ncbi:MAG: zinc ribbon domain-containing protein [Candidatus Aminicenantes bacterium]|nr:zinc ribbon domain-containing protein [Candidatus Aminicenantes bacterium]
MPLYEYKCKKCRETTEVLQKAKDKPPEKCPKCGGSVAKLVSSPAIQFKGTGWYITDYAKKGPEAAGATDGAKTGAKAESKAEIKSGDGETAKKKKPEKADKSDA